MSKAVIDTGVFVDYIDRKSPLHDVARNVINSIGQLEVLLPYVTIAEICYVTARVLREAGIEEWLEKSVEFVEWLQRHPAVEVVCSTELDVEAAKVKLRYGLALADCYVLALSKLKNCKAVFRKREKEMPDKVEKDFDVIFLEDYVGGDR
ncbi:type II toxin-antitoxin system VapC family toxin [Archaeoglobus fulgidus]|uniref:PIN domain-containing protein n=1 Tax=Archaeoglobus fulgidus (strain ATCC 49558 / DSM 4304 / JCM 9628 / NBRC 100126 / VC-16) TaxID=224325 RepID=O28886_ARCFU|nr:type II toxin-antitoxin system VapC family toxin [Archaeoglobus fulgidus]AAB89881.1 predicted coding region AF_1385 [Archaeoglobus fulgidus DSM 4304]